jgi:VanZ family protein
MITVVVPNTLTKLRRDWIWPLVVAGTIFLASSREVTAPEFTRWIPSFDKVAHFSVYGLLGTLTLRGLGTRRWAHGLAIAAVSLFGASDEWHQSFVPGRSCEVADWVADTLGAALAVSLYARWGRYRRLLETSLVRPTRVTDGTQPAR